MLLWQQRVSLLNCGIKRYLTGKRDNPTNLFLSSVSRNKLTGSVSGDLPSGSTFPTASKWRWGSSKRRSLIELDYFWYHSPTFRRGFEIKLNFCCIYLHGSGVECVCGWDSIHLIWAKLTPPVYLCVEVLGDWCPKVIPRHIHVTCLNSEFSFS